MPEYPIPSWITPEAGQRWGELYATGFGLGQRQESLGLQAAELGQRANQNSMEYALRQAELKANEENQRQKNLVDMEQLAVEKAYKDATIGLARDKLQADAQQLSRQALALQKFSQRYQELLQGGANPEDAYRTAMLEAGGDIFLNVQGGAGRFAEALKPPARTAAERMGGALTDRQRAQGRVLESRIRGLDAQLRNLESEAAKTPGDKKLQQSLIEQRPNIIRQINAFQKQLDDLYATPAAEQPTPVTRPTPQAFIGTPGGENLAAIPSGQPSAFIGTPGQENQAILPPVKYKSADKVKQAYQNGRLTNAPSPVWRYNTETGQLEKP